MLPPAASSHSSYKNPDRECRYVVCARSNRDTLCCLVDSRVLLCMQCCSVIKLSGTKKIAHLVEGLPCGHADFTLITRTHTEKLGMVECTYNLVLQRQRQADSWSFVASQSHAPGRLWAQRETLPQITRMAERE